MRTLVARLDNAGDVLLAGPAVRAAAAGGDVVLLCGPRGNAAAGLLPGVSETVVWEAPWVGDDAPPVDRRDVAALVQRLRRLRVDRAAILTSFHQSPLPLALVLRMAGVAEIAATSVDFPGTLLDHRLPDRADLHEVEQGLAVVAALGLHLPPGDDGRLRIRRRRCVAHPFAGQPFVVVHPGASVPARGYDAGRAAELVEVLRERGHRVAVTGGPDERALTAVVAGRRRPGVADLGGRTELSELAGVIGEAQVLVSGNTGPVHLAAAVGTPVVEIFAPVVAPARWRPWRVPSILLGDLDIECAGCRARCCPRAGQPCLSDVTPAAVADAVERLAGSPASNPGMRSPGRRVEVRA